jgi:WD40 repeat protein
VPTVSVGARLKGHADYINSLEFAPDGSFLASADVNGLAIFWDIKTGERRGMVRGNRGWVGRIGFSPNGRLLASACRDGAVRVWDLKTGKQAATLQSQPDSVKDVAFMSDTELIAVETLDLVVWDVQSGKEKRRLHLWDRDQGHINLGFVKSPDGAMALFDRTGAILVTPPTLEILQAWRPTGLQYFDAAASSADGRRLALAGESAIGGYHSLCLLKDVNTWRDLGAIRSSTEASIDAIAFSRDGRFVVTSQRDGILKLWSVKKLIAPPTP